MLALLEIGPNAGRITFTTRHETVVGCTEEAARLFERLTAGSAAADQGTGKQVDKLGPEQLSQLVRTVRPIAPGALRPRVTKSG